MAVVAVTTIIACSVAGRARADAEARLEAASRQLAEERRRADRLQAQLDSDLNRRQVSGSGRA